MEMKRNVTIKMLDSAKLVWRKMLAETAEQMSCSEVKVKRTAAKYIRKN